MTLELEVLDQAVLGNSLLQWLIAVAALLFSYLLLRLAKHMVGRRLAAFSTRTETQWDDVIAEAIKHAGPREIVLIAGKGHEDYQIIGEQRLPFSDVEQARSALAERSA